MVLYPFSRRPFTERTGASGDQRVVAWNGEPTPGTSTRTISIRPCFASRGASPRAERMCGWIPQR